MSSSALPEVSPEPTIRLHHGTDENSATDLLLHGVDQGQAAVFNVSGEFWATTGDTDADTFAQVNPAGGVPARYSFDIPLWVLRALLNANPPRAYLLTSAGVDWYEFSRTSFGMLNQYMTNRQMDLV